MVEMLKLKKKHFKIIIDNDFRRIKKRTKCLQQNH